MLIINVEDAGINCASSGRFDKYLKTFFVPKYSWMKCVAGYIYIYISVTGIS